MPLLSPLSGSERVELIDLIPVNRIIDAYRKNFQLDVKRYFADHHQVRVFRCHDTGYRFYYPFTLIGDTAFGTSVQRFAWLADHPRWELTESLRLIAPTDKVLEIEPRSGHFIKQLAALGIEVHGLAQQEATAQALQAQGLKVHHGSLSEFAEQRPGHFDLVCVFHVLATLASVKDFVRAALHALRRGGRLLLCVPNNHGFLGKAEDDALNLPPHTMGLWDEHSLRAIAWVFPELNVERIVVQPLQPEQENQYYKTYVGTVNNRWAGRLFSSLTFPLAKPLIRARANRIRGRLVLAVYTKD
jgi:SAM-dependent methyltransferase